ncbi:hypothetical protein QFZ37_000926 [Chryseobacterium ginsenosidimutans]|nr:hypothetical protein [Chryseobacterium ginsenosidimutans]
MEAYLLENFNEDRYKKNINKTNLYSLVTIISTLLVTIFFLFSLLK